MTTPTETYIFTIGHGNKTIDELVKELKKYNIQYLIDVRTMPFSQHHQQFNKANLIVYFKQNKDIKYDWRGDKLGGLPPEDWDCRADDGKIIYEKMKHQPILIEGIQQIVKANEMKLKVALMCSESDPRQCHRSKLLSEMLRERGVKVLHIVQGQDRLKQKTIETLSHEAVMRDINDEANTNNLFGFDNKITSRKVH